MCHQWASSKPASFRNKGFTLHLFWRKGEGFTLIEFLVVISIMTILALIVVPNYQRMHRQFALQRSASKIAQDIRGVQEMAIAMTKCTQSISCPAAAGETPSGLVDGSNTIFTLDSTPKENTESVYESGIRLKRTEDYTISGGIITFNVAPLTNSLIVVDYQKA